jgi:hypothetical protein
MWIAKALDILTPKAGFSVCEDNIDKIEWFSEDIERPSNDTILSKVSELQAAEPMRMLRAERDQLIASTDWRATVDYPGSDQAAWLTYRQALRDLPANSTPSLDENGQLTGANWPTPPE